jgi:hypothetical protein
MKNRFIPTINKPFNIYINEKFKADRLLPTLVSAIFTSFVILSNILVFLEIISYNKTILFL